MVLMIKSTDRLMVKSTDSYLEQLLKLVPADVVAAYTVLLGLVPAEEPTKYWGTFIVGLVLVILIRSLWTETGADRVTDISVVMISVAAYVIWVYNMDGPFRVYNLYDAWWGAVFLAGFTILAPKFYVKLGIPINEKYANLRKKPSS